MSRYAERFYREKEDHMTTALLDRAEEEEDVEPFGSGNQLLNLIKAVVTNPDVSVEKIQALWDMQKQMEAKRAKDAFKAALIAAQDEVQALAWDKINLERNSRNVGYPKIEKMIKPIRQKYGFTETFDTEDHPSPDTMYFCCDLAHKDGHEKRYRLPMPIDPAGPKGGGVMTKPQAVSSGVSYGMRNLAKMIWNIPMLVDKDDTDGNAPYEKITKRQAADLRALAEETNSDIKKFCEYYEIDKLESLPASSYKSAVTAFEKKRSR